MEQTTPTTPPSGVVRWLCCGAVAGLAVDLGLYPLDTLKTRLQSAGGFHASGGFRSLYSGMASVAIGSAPGAALFFATYAACRNRLGMGVENPLVDALAASSAEVVACSIRVPTELIKQRAQARPACGVRVVVLQLHRDAGLSGFYRGYASTVLREIPFSLIEFPLWEALKRAVVSHRKQRRRTTNEHSPMGNAATAAEIPDTGASPLEGAACGSVAGAVAAAITTPLDVAKTRIMLSNDRTMTIPRTLLDIATRDGFSKLYAGVVPRTLWMAAGGFIFFGAFEFALAVSKRIA